MSVGAAAVYLTDIAALRFIQSTVAANWLGQQALSATVRGLDCHVGSLTGRERRERQAGRGDRK